VKVTGAAVSGADQVPFAPGRKTVLTGCHAPPAWTRTGIVFSKGHIPTFPRWRQERDP
jgi:hypothetical protein